MRSRAEDYYRRGLEAQQCAAQVAELRLKKAFQQTADNWFTLAEQAQWLEQQYGRPQYGRPTPKEPASKLAPSSSSRRDREAALRPGIAAGASAPPRKALRRN